MKGVPKGLKDLINPYNHLGNLKNATHLGMDQMVDHSIDKVDMSVYGGELIQSAIQAKQPKILQKYLDKGADIHNPPTTISKATMAEMDSQGDSYRQSPFIIQAARQGNMEVFNMLVEKGASLDEQGYIGFISKKKKNQVHSNILGAACYFDNYDLVHHLLGNDMLSHQLNFKSYELDDKFEKNITRPEKMELSMLTPLMMAIVGKGSFKLIDLLLQDPDVDQNCKDSRDNTILHLAVQRGEPDIVEHLLDMTIVDQDLRNADGDTIMSLAEAQGDQRIKTLIEAKEIGVHSHTGVDALDQMLMEEEKEAKRKEQKKAKKKKKKEKKVEPSDSEEEDEQMRLEEEQEKKERQKRKKERDEEDKQARKKSKRRRIEVIDDQQDPVDSDEYAKPQGFKKIHVKKEQPLRSTRAPVQPRATPKPVVQAPTQNEPKKISNKQHKQMKHEAYMKKKKEEEEAARKQDQPEEGEGEGEVEKKPEVQISFEDRMLEKYGQMKEQTPGLSYQMILKTVTNKKHKKWIKEQIEKETEDKQSMKLKTERMNESRLESQRQKEQAEKEEKERELEEKKQREENYRKRQEMYKEQERKNKEIKEKRAKERKEKEKKEREEKQLAKEQEMKKKEKEIVPKRGPRPRKEAVNKVWNKKSMTESQLEQAVEEPSLPDESQEEEEEETPQVQHPLDNMYEDPMTHSIATPSVDPDYGSTYIAPQLDITNYIPLAEHYGKIQKLQEERDNAVDMEYEAQSALTTQYKINESLQERILELEKKLKQVEQKRDEAENSLFNQLLDKKMVDSNGGEVEDLMKSRPNEVKSINQYKQDIKDLLALSNEVIRKKDQIIYNRA